MSAAIDMTQEQLIDCMRDIRNQVEQRCDVVGEIFIIAGHLLAHSLESLPPAQRLKAFRAWVQETEWVLTNLPQDPPEHVIRH